MPNWCNPNGWTCIACGDKFLNDTTGKEIADDTEGTLCKKCHEEDLFWHNDTPNNIQGPRTGRGQAQAVKSASSSLTLTLG